MQTVGLLLTAISLLMILLSACGGATDSTRLPDITSETEEGFYDLTFRITGHNRLPNGMQTFVATGLYKDRKVGLELVLGSTWEQVSLGSDLPTAFRGTVELRSLGAESDALLGVMDQLYGTKLHPEAMNSGTAFTGITLGGDPRDPGLGLVKIKLFFEPDEQERYAELYVNIDLSAEKIYVNEKDTDYRTPIIHALAKSQIDGG